MQPTTDLNPVPPAVQPVAEPVVEPAAEHIEQVAEQTVAVPLEMLQRFLSEIHANPQRRYVQPDDVAFVWREVHEAKYGVRRRQPVLRAVPA